MIEEIYKESLKKAKTKIWIMSDLQQCYPEWTKECLSVSMKDFESLENPADMIWYLGDAIEGLDKDHIVKMTKLQEDAFEKTGLPLYYVMGNHDMQLSHKAKESNGPIDLPFYDMIKTHHNWHAIEECDKWYFKETIGNFAVYFLSDHIAKDNSWAMFHGTVFYGQENYNMEERVKELKEDMASETRKIITVSHYSYSGGNRASSFQSQLLPLPNNVKIHFYGHAHIGDYKWAKENAYRRISCVDFHDIPQIEVSSFEHMRGDVCRSVFLHIYEDDSFGIFFRDHDNHTFVESYFPQKENHLSKHDLDLDGKKEAEIRRRYEALQTHKS